MSALPRTVACMLSCAAVGLPAHAQIAAPARQKDDGGVQQWMDQKGSIVEAHFVRIDGTGVVVVDRIGERTLPVSRLTRQDQAIAKRMGEIVNVFKPVRTGRFMMGSRDSEPGRSTDETYHEVLTSGFTIKVTEVTWNEWNAVRNFAHHYGYFDISPGSNGTQGWDADLNPVVGITWWDAVKWCNLKSQLENRKPAYFTDTDNRGLPKDIFKNGTAEIRADWFSEGYRLPTEAEWEFACRTRDSGWEFHTGSIRETGIARDSNLDKAGWYAFNSNGEPHPVSLKDPNQFGLYDMHGNAAEWCWDVASIPGPAAIENPRGPQRGDQRIVRGGSWADPARACRAAARPSLTPGATIPDRAVGFRPVLRSARP